MPYHDWPAWAVYACYVAYVCFLVMAHVALDFSEELMVATFAQVLLSFRSSSASSQRLPFSQALMAAL